MKRSYRPLMTALVIGLAATSFLGTSTDAQEGTSKETKETSEILKDVRVLAFDLPKSETEPSGGRVVLIHLARKDQMVVAIGGTFQPKPGFVFSVDKINQDGSCYVSGTGVSMGRIRVATKKERDDWAKKVRTNGFDS